jgi:2-haloacid dehalogenase
LPPKSTSHRPSVAVFDMGGVLIDYNPRHLYRKLIPRPEEMEDFLANVTTREWHTRQDYDGNPAIATRELQALHPDKEALIAAYYDRFDEMLDHTFAPMVELVERLNAAGTPLYLLSNAPGFLDSWLRGPARAKHPFIRCFRNFVVSGFVGCWKPDAAIYELVCRTGGFQPGDAVFIDDVLANVDGARAIGMAGIHHRSAAETTAELRALGLPT